MNRYNLAQINIAEAKAEMDTETMSGFDKFKSAFTFARPFPVTE